MKAEMLEPQIIMATDDTGQSTPMACGIMLFKSIQWRPCSRLLMQLPAFDKNIIITEHDFMVFDQQCSYDIIIGGGFLRKIGMNLRYNDSTIEWLGNTAPMDRLNNPEPVAREVESCLYQMDLDKEDLTL